jgi:hypothetical protein
VGERPAGAPAGALPHGAAAASAQFSYQGQATFQTTGQNLWGSGTAAGDLSVPILPEQRWNTSGSSGGISHGFGGAISGSTSGDIGMWVHLHNLSGAANVVYPMKVQFAVGAATASGVTITSSWTPFGAGILSTGTIGGQMDLDANASLNESAQGRACAFSACASFPILPQTSFGEQTVRISPTLASGAQFDLANLTVPGVVGTFQAPTLTAVPLASAGGRELAAVGQGDVLHNVMIDLVGMIAEAAHAPLPASDSTTYSVLSGMPSASVSYTGIAAGVVGSIGIQQAFQFVPKPLLALAFAQPIQYTIMDPSGAPITPWQTGRVVGLPVGDSAVVRGAGNLSVSPSVTLPNTFTSSTAIQGSLGDSVQALAASAGISNLFSDSPGPLFSYVYPLCGQPGLTCTKTVSGNRWTLGGFQRQNLPTFQVSFAQ